MENLDIILTNFTAGLLSSFSPCTYPLIPIILSIIGINKDSSYLTGLKLSCTYVAGMIILYVSLGITFSFLGLLAGSIFQNKWVTASLSLLMLCLALYTTGLFKKTFNLPFVDYLTNKVTLYKGYTGVFLLGLISGVIATPCTGPILIGILTLIAEKQDFSKAFFYMLIYSIGMGTPFIFLGTFSVLIKKIPKSGNWMFKIKLLLSFFLISASVHYANLSYKAFCYSKSVNNFLLVQKKITDARLHNKQVIMEFSADWCDLCKKLEKQVLNNKIYSKTLSDYEIVKIDLTAKSKIEKNFRKYFNVVGVPVILKMDTGEKLPTSINELTKFLKDPKNKIIEK